MTFTSKPPLRVGVRDPDNPDHHWTAPPAPAA